MTSKKVLLGAALALSGLAGMGCAGAPTEIRIQGVAVPSSWVDRAEKESDPGSDPAQAQVCLSLARKLWERDVLESLRYFRKGALLGDAECCRQYLAYAETPSANQSQRVYARLFIEGLLRKGPVLTRSGEDIRSELYYQLCWGWRYTAPCFPAKVKQVLQSMVEQGATPERLNSPFIAQMIRETGLRVDSIVRKRPLAPDVHLYAAENAGESIRRPPAPPAPSHPGRGEWIVSEANAWGGGSDRLLTSATVLAFLVNEKGEPSFRGTRLWICNLGEIPVYLTSLAAGQSNRELAPGREEVLSLATEGTELVTGIPLNVRHLRVIR